MLGMNSSAQLPAVQAPRRPATPRCAHGSCSWPGPLGPAIVQPTANATVWARGADSNAEPDSVPGRSRAGRCCSTLPGNF